MTEIKELNRSRKKLSLITREINSCNQALDQLHTAPVLELLNRDDRRKAEKDWKKVSKIEQRIEVLGIEGEKIAERIKGLIHSG